jgi:hypothetical protein
MTEMTLWDHPRFVHSVAASLGDNQHARLARTTTP